VVLGAMANLTQPSTDIPMFGTIGVVLFLAVWGSTALRDHLPRQSCQIMCHARPTGWWRPRTARIVMLAGLLVIAGVGADEVVMRNGDRLTGSVVRTDQSSLRLETDYAGTLSIDLSKVQNVRFDEPRLVLLDDQTKGKINEFSRTAQKISVRRSASAEPIRVAPGRIRVIEPEPWESGDGGRLSGRVNLAVNSEEGNTDQNELDFDYKLDYRRRRHRLESSGIIEYDTNDGVKTTEKWSMDVRYSRLFEGPWYAAGWILAGHDRFADRRLRIGVAPTLGYRFFEGTERNLRTELGPGYINEDFYDTEDRQFWGPFWYLDYDQFVWNEQLQLYHTHRAFWAVDDTTKQLWRSWTGLRIPLVAGVVGGIEYAVEYDSDPAVEAKDTDTTLRLKVGYQW
jgi:putative salt-induced outer membrane protein YdiY